MKFETRTLYVVKFSEGSADRHTRRCYLPGNPDRWNKGGFIVRRAEIGDVIMDRLHIFKVGERISVISNVDNRTHLGDRGEFLGIDMSKIYRPDITASLEWGDDYQEGGEYEAAGDIISSLFYEPGQRIPGWQGGSAPPLHCLVYALKEYSIHDSNSEDHQLFPFTKGYEGYDE